jgi:hypothetical protein
VFVGIKATGHSEAGKKWREGRGTRFEAGGTAWQSLLLLSTRLSRLLADETSIGSGEECRNQLKFGIIIHEKKLLFWCP